MQEKNDFASFMKTHEGRIDAVVSPANAYGLMDGGYDKALTDYFGNDLQLAVQKEIIKRFYGEQPVGTSFSSPIPDHSGMLLIHTPTMRSPSQIKDIMIVYPGYSQIHNEEDRKEISHAKMMEQLISLSKAVGKIV